MLEHAHDRGDAVRPRGRRSAASALRAQRRDELQHVRGNLDNWDPALTDALAVDRELMLVDYPGVGSSSGDFGPTIADTTRAMIAILTGLDRSEVDQLGAQVRLACGPRRPASRLGCALGRPPARDGTVAACQLGQQKKPRLSPSVRAKNKPLWVPK